ncbi:chorismate mutase [Streptomyces sp. RM72]|uniref:chorismate mutase n=1 Tax=Streptomyces TaxID=1883 RepID=UPI001B35B573|nr:chorismate mutase [Streptomyces sp. RM72]MBQ0890180.1 chorismate mutase [Streptomyces sp. RM72]
MRISESVEDYIAEQRSRIDELDGLLIETIKARREVSLGIQRRRTEARGPKSDTPRENKIIEKYGEELGGRQGVSLALEVLKACRLP